MRVLAPSVLPYAIVFLMNIVAAEKRNGWEPAPFMDAPPFGLDSTHTFGFALRGKAYATTGNVRVKEFDFCGDCRNMTQEFRQSIWEEFSDAFYSYDPARGWTDLGPHPGGTRGFAQGDIMDRGTEREILYFGLGQTRSVTEKFPRWRFDSNGTYVLSPEATSYPRLQDWWSFDGTNWTRLRDFPGIGRTHPAVSAEGGKVYVGMGYGELCPSVADPCAANHNLGADADPRGKSSNLADVWVYDVATDSWEEAAPFPYPVHHPLHFGVPGAGSFFLGGHNGAVILDKVWRHNYFTKGEDSWTEMEPIPGVGRVAATQFVYKEKGYILGGETASRENNLLEGFSNSEKNGMLPPEEGVTYKEDHRSMATNEFLEYDPKTDSWTKLPSTPDAGSRWASSSFVLDEYAYNFQGVIRKGHYHFGNFTMVWPQQGYRIYLGELSKDNIAVSSTGKISTFLSVVMLGGCILMLQ